MAKRFKITEENYMNLARILAIESGLPFKKMTEFTRELIGKELTSAELTTKVNAHIEDLVFEALRLDEQTEMSIDEEGRIFFYDKDNPDETIYPE